MREETAAARAGTGNAAPFAERTASHTRRGALTVEIFRQLDLDALVKRALDEDLGQGDITTAATVKPGSMGRARITVKEPRMIFCGGDLLDMCSARRCRARILRSRPRVRNSQGATSSRNRGQPRGVADWRAHRAQLHPAHVGHRDGDARSMSRRSRVPARRLSIRARHIRGCARSRSMRSESAAAQPSLRPRWRRADQGQPHRGGRLGAAAIEGARRITPHTLTIEIECETLAQVEEARDAGADIILLDNMSSTKCARRVRSPVDKLILEASGNVNLDTVRAIAETGVDLISVGALTHSARAMDISMRIDGV